MVQTCRLEDFLGIQKPPGAPRRTSEAACHIITTCLCVLKRSLRTFCGTSVNSLIIVGVVEADEGHRGSRPAPEPAVSVPDSRIFCCSSTLPLITSFMEPLEPCWPEQNICNLSSLQARGAPWWDKARTTETAVKNNNICQLIFQKTSNI